MEDKIMNRNNKGQFMAGENHPNWKGGFDAKKYRDEYYSKPENKERQKIAGKKRRKEKPKEARNKIIQLVGELPRIELFARSSQKVENGGKCWL